MARSKRNVYGIEIEGLDELQEAFKRVRNFPKKEITKAAKLGMKDPLAQAKQNAPVDEGILQKSIKQKMEKTKNRRTKTVYKMEFNPKFAEHFKGKKIKRIGLYNPKSTKEYGYYPIAMEYGFWHKSGWIPGRKFIRQAIESNQQESLQKQIDHLDDVVKKLY